MIQICDTIREFRPNEDDRDDMIIPANSGRIPRVAIGVVGPLAAWASSAKPLGLVADFLTPYEQDEQG
jgi:hypothetical protein